MTCVTVKLFIRVQLLLSPRRGDDLVRAGQIGKAAVLWDEVYAVRAVRAGKGETLQQRHQEDKKLHASQRLANTGSLPCEETIKHTKHCRDNNKMKILLVIFKGLLVGYYVTA